MVNAELGADVIWRRGRVVAAQASVVLQAELTVAGDGMVGREDLSRPTARRRQGGLELEIRSWDDDAPIHWPGR